MEELYPGLYRLKIPLTQNRLGYLNSYLFTTPDRNLIIDTGLRQDVCYDAMMGYISDLSVDMARTDILLTHFHPDHGGLTTRIASPTSRIYLGAIEADVLSADLSYEYLIDFMVRKGVPRDDIPDLFLNGRFKNYLESVMNQIILLNEGDQIVIGDYTFKVYVTPGHTNGHVCLYDGDNKLLIVGDHILDGITPGIECIYDDTNPLGDYYQSLDRIKSLDVNHVLPGHRNLFTECDKRIDEILSHHQHRIDDMLKIMRDGPLNAYEIASRMRWQLSGDHWDETEKLHRWFATSETVAHLRFTEEVGIVQKISDETGDRYQIKPV